MSDLRPADVPTARAHPSSEPLRRSSAAIRIRGRMEPPRTPKKEPVTAGRRDLPVARLSVELRVLGMVATLWSVGVAHAIAWVYWIGLPSSAHAELPWLPLVVPQVLALLLVLGQAFSWLPYERWPRSTRESPLPAWPWLLLGWPALVLAPLLLLRHRAAVRRPATSQRYDAAFHRLLGAPRTIGIRFAALGGVAYMIDAVVLGTHAGWPRHVIVAMALLWVAILGPLAAVLHGLGRSMLRPEVLSAPSTPTAAFERSAGLRTPLIMIATLASVGAIAAPLCASYLWLAIANPVRAPPRALLDLLYVVGVVTVVACAIAFTLIATDLRRDVLRAKAQVGAVVKGVAPTPIAPGSISSGEVHDLVAAVDRLIGGIRKATIAKYVAIEKAEEGERLKSQFLANMSHDLRSPLNSILGFSELLLRGIDGDLTPDQAEMIQTIHDHGRELLLQIDDILDAAKLQAQRMEFHPEPTPPANLLSRAIATARERVRGEVEYSIEVSPGLRPALVDPFRVVQALTNILVFAAERLERGTITVGIREGWVDDRRQILIAVQTPTSPVSGEELERARQGFYRVAGHRGLGLGLPIAAQIFEASGGSLTLDPVDPGMVLIATLPAQQSRASWLRMKRIADESGPHPAAELPTARSQPNDR